MFARSSLGRLASATRSYATNATQHVKPPIALSGVDGTYATALYTAAKKTSSLEPVSRSVAALGNLLAKDKRLEPVISSPTLTSADKAAAIEEVIKALPSGAGQKEVKNLLEVLAENNRLGALPGVVSKFDELVRADKGEVDVVVTSAQPLDSRTLGRIESAVAGSGVLEAGKKSRVVNRVQADIKGGLIVEIGDRTIDLSVSSKIAKMNKLLTDTL